GEFSKNNGILEYAVNLSGIDYLHIYNSEEALEIVDRLRKINVKMILEAINIDHVLYKKLNRNREELYRIKKLQTEAMEAADYVLCRSELDKSHIRLMGIDENKIGVYAGAINCSDFDCFPRHKKRYKIVFLGHMYYPPNENSLKLIAKKILPQLKKIDPRYTVSVVGIAPDKVKKEIFKTDIIFRGGVDDLNKELRKYDIAIAPIFEGSGTRLKILDYLASGILTIATNFSIEGLRSSIKENLIVEDDVDNYAAKIDFVMRNMKDFITKARNGRRFVEKYYNWDDNLRPFLDTYRKLDAGRRKRDRYMCVSPCITSKNSM
ncbi:MAG: glycosyltransferase family 4 protein, partial [Patescibacteria group bacterium]